MKGRTIEIEKQGGRGGGRRMVGDKDRDLQCTGSLPQWP